MCDSRLLLKYLNDVVGFKSLMVEQLDTKNLPCAIDILNNEKEARANREPLLQINNNGVVNLLVGNSIPNSSDNSSFE